MTSTTRTGTAAATAATGAATRTGAATPAGAAIRAGAGAASSYSPNTDEKRHSEGCILQKPSPKKPIPNAFGNIKYQKTLQEPYDDNYIKEFLSRGRPPPPIMDACPILHHSTDTGKYLNSLVDSGKYELPRDDNYGFFKVLRYIRFEPYFSPCCIERARILVNTYKNQHNDSTDNSFIESVKSLLSSTYQKMKKFEQLEKDALASIYNIKNMIDGMEDKTTPENKAKIRTLFNNCIQNLNDGYQEIRKSAAEDAKLHTNLESLRFSFSNIKSDGLTEKMKEIYMQKKYSIHKALNYNFYFEKLIDEISDPDYDPKQKLSEHYELSHPNPPPPINDRHAYDDTFKNRMGAGMAGVDIRQSFVNPTKRTTIKHLNYLGKHEEEGKGTILNQIRDAISKENDMENKKMYLGLVDTLSNVIETIQPENRGSIIYTIDYGARTEKERKQLWGNIDRLGANRVQLDKDLAHKKHQLSGMQYNLIYTGEQLLGLLMSKIKIEDNGDIIIKTIEEEIDSTRKAFENEFKRKKYHSNWSKYDIDKTIGRISVLLPDKKTNKILEMQQIALNQIKENNEVEKQVIKMKHDILQEHKELSTKEKTTTIMQNICDEITEEIKKIDERQETIIKKQNEIDLEIQKHQSKISNQLNGNENHQRQNQSDTKRELVIRTKRDLSNISPTNEDENQQQEQSMEIKGQQKSPQDQPIENREKTVANSYDIKNENAQPAQSMEIKGQQKSQQDKPIENREKTVANSYEIKNDSTQPAQSMEETREQRKLKQAELIENRQKAVENSYGIENESAQAGWGSKIPINNNGEKYMQYHQETKLNSSLNSLFFTDFHQIYKSIYQLKEMNKSNEQETIDNSIAILREMQLYKANTLLANSPYKPGGKVESIEKEEALHKGYITSKIRHNINAYEQASNNVDRENSLNYVKEAIQEYNDRYKNHNEDNQQES